MNKPNNHSSSNKLARERTEFAKYRTQQAADRSLMAWIRTSLSLISFGFGLPTIVDAIEKTQATKEINLGWLVIFIGVSFILLGIFSLVNALMSHHRMLKAIRSGNVYIR